jgi:hypothetical protein
MEKENTSSSAVLKIVLYITGSLIILFMIYFAVMSVLSTRGKASSINSEFGFNEKDTRNKDIRLFSDSAFISLNREKAYYQARVLLAETDSICLALNLADSSAVLEINGVAVHRAKVSTINISKVFNMADEYALSSMFAIPFTIIDDFATIKKEPVMIKMAPKDTSEYKPDILPDTTNSEAVNYMFELNSGIRLYISQDPDIKDANKTELFVFDLGERLKNLRVYLKSIISFKVPKYHPAIRIRMPKDDAKIIYRALPKHGQIAIFR